MQDKAKEEWPKRLSVKKKPERQWIANSNEILHTPGEENVAI